MTDVGSMLRAALPWRSIVMLATGFIIGAAHGNTAFADALRKPRDGATLYHNYCSVCHGDKGDGRSRASASLVPPPRDFTDPAVASRLTREYMIAVVKDGRPGTAMAGWSAQLAPTEIEMVVDYLRNTFVRTARDPVLARGRLVYGHTCAQCHGDRGQGSGTHDKGPRAFRVAQPELTRERLTSTLASNPHSSLTSGALSRLPQSDVDAVAQYIRNTLLAAQPTISGTSAHGAAPAGRTAAAPGNPVDMSLPLPNGLVGNAGRGARFYAANCATCHGASGDGAGPRAYFIQPRPRNFTTAEARTAFNRPALFAAVANGKTGTEMPAWNKVLTDQQIADVAEHVFRAYIAPADRVSRRP